MRSTSLLLLTSLTPTYAFSFMGGGNNNGMKTSTKVSSTSSTELNIKQDEKSISDPLGLYPKDSPERLAGLIKPLESPLERDETVVDPLSLYQDTTELTGNADMSMSLPFLKRPQYLDGTLPGDRGFDPFNFSSDPSALNWYRESEIKHARIAMLASVGWVLSELSHNSIASQLGLKSILNLSDKVPSILNGGLDRTNPLFWVGAISAAAALEFISIRKDGGVMTEPGDFNFDPLGLAGKTDKRQFFNKEAELFNGRLAMLAITGFAAQEFVTNDAVINQTPIFFKFFGDVVPQLLGTGGAVSV